MKREQQNYDPFENDSLSIGKSSDVSKFSNSREQFPIKIGSSFIQEEDSESVSTDIHNMSFDDLINQRIAKQRSSKEESSNCYTREQISKINKLNEKIKIMIAFQTQFKEQIKKNIKKLSNDKEALKNLPKEFIEIAKKQVKTFQTNFSETKLQPIKLNRVSKIPKQQRVCYLNKKDKNEVKKRKYIQVLITQKDQELQIKRGMHPSQTNRTDIDETTKGLQNYVKEYVSQINSDHMRNEINRLVKEQLEQMGSQLKKTMKKNKDYIQKLNQQTRNLITAQARAQSIINQQNIVREIQLQTKIIQTSENLLQIVPSKTLFSLMPNFARQNKLSLDNI